MHDGFDDHSFRYFVPVRGCVIFRKFKAGMRFEPHQRAILRIRIEAPNTACPGEAEAKPENCGKEPFVDGHYFQCIDPPLFGAKRFHTTPSTLEPLDPWPLGPFTKFAQRERMTRFAYNTQKAKWVIVGRYALFEPFRAP